MGRVVRFATAKAAPRKMRHTSRGTAFPQSMVRFRFAPSAVGVARRLPRVFHPIREGCSEQFQHIDRGPDSVPEEFRKMLIAEHLLFSTQRPIRPVMRFSSSSGSGNGQPGHGFNDWASFRAGTEVFFTKYLSWPLREGLTTRKALSRRKTALLSSTLAPQIHDRAAKSAQAASSSAGRCCVCF